MSDESGSQVEQLKSQLDHLSNERDGLYESLRNIERDYGLLQAQLDNSTREAMDVAGKYETTLHDGAKS